jgi:hypothetical protein
MPLWMRASGAKIVESEIVTYRARDDRRGSEDVVTPRSRGFDPRRSANRDIWGLCRCDGVDRHDGCSLLFSFLQSFVNTAHGFLSRVDDNTTFDWRNRPNNSSKFCNRACVSLAWVPVGASLARAVGSI